MAEGNGQQPNLSRLERIEAAVAAFIDDHERLRADHERYRVRQERLETSHEASQQLIILIQDAQLRNTNAIGSLTVRVDDLAVQVAELAGKVDGVIGSVDTLIETIDRDHREFHERLSRLEAKQ